MIGSRKIAGRRRTGLSSSKPEPAVAADEEFLDCNAVVSRNEKFARGADRLSAELLYVLDRHRGVSTIDTIPALVSNHPDEQTATRISEGGQCLAVDPLILILKAALGGIALALEVKLHGLLGALVDQSDNGGLAFCN